MKERLQSGMTAKALAYMSEWMAVAVIRMEK
jgi:hypothetical protein